MFSAFAQMNLDSRTHSSLNCLNIETFLMQPDINSQSEKFCNTITAKELEIEQPSAESCSQHSSENTASEISGKNGECVKDEKNVGESQRSLDMEVVDSVSGSLVKLTSHEPHEAPQMMQTCNTSSKLHN